MTLNYLWDEAMAVYTVHAPRPKRYEAEPDPERFIFVRDGFSFWAFVLGPLWMLRNRMWLVFLGYLAIVAALQVTLNALNVSPAVRFLVGILLALLIGFEASTLRRFTLAGRRFRNVGIIVGDDLEAAERRFFDVWSKRDALAPAVLPHTPTAVPAGGLVPPSGVRP